MCVNICGYTINVWVPKTGWNHPMYVPFFMVGPKSLLAELACVLVQELHSFFQSSNQRLAYNLVD